MTPTCTAPKDEGVLGGPRCGASATYQTLLGPRCTTCTAKLRLAMRDPSTMGNVLSGRARTDDEIDRLIKPIN